MPPIKKPLRAGMSDARSRDDYQQRSHQPAPAGLWAATAGFYDTMIHDFDLAGERLEEFEVSESKFVSKIF